MADDRLELIEFRPPAEQVADASGLRHDRCRIARAAPADADLDAMERLVRSLVVGTEVRPQ